ncbi:hypothetical protein H7K05_25515 [Priestia aryabhattai]|uniref:hypothetical protein n=1 Tax=Priestia aryabhattai TaxID=412384 RepID=UPI001C8EC626|nr:hypothetical protein [Priestia aryabhattai]MBY0008682.1 hypothetical protein [Priestia aryabhattai]MBY0045298.1 hypothetical protein [Priestia aryabhattai]
MYILIGFWKEMWSHGELSNLSFSVLLLPNILQLVGTILTLFTAVLASLGKFGDTRSKIINSATLSSKREVVNKITEEDKFIKSANDLVKYSRELIYAGMGIFLITLGFTTSTINLSASSLTPYLCIPLVLASIYLFYILYNVIKPLRVHKKVHFKRLMSLFLFLAYILGTFFALIFFPIKILISLSFLSSTVTFLFVSILVIEIIIYNTLIENNQKKYQRYSDKKEG